MLEDTQLYRITTENDLKRELVLNQIRVKKNRVKRELGEIFFALYFETYRYKSVQYEFINLYHLPV